MDLINVDEYKETKNITSPDRDGIIIQLIAAASSVVKHYCRTTFVDYFSTSKIEYFDSNEREIFPSELPINSIISLEYSEDGGETYTALVAGTDFFHNRYLDILEANGPYFNPTIIKTNSLKLTYTGGYDQYNIPEDVKLACVYLIDYYLEADYKERKVLGNAVVEGFSTDNIPGHIKALLGPYRRL